MCSPAGRPWGPSKIDPKIYHFFDRFLVPFWVPLGVHFGALGGPSWPQVGSKTPLATPFLSKSRFSKKQGKPMVFQCFCPLRWHLKRPKITPQGGLKEVLFRCSKLSSILVPFGLHFGSLLGALLGPKRVPKIDQICIPG